jgi:biopolymer transport protein ExbD
MRIKATESDSNELINISSMLDVMFILIIFFLVTTTFKEEEIDHMVKLPVDARNQSLTQSTGNLLKINVRKSGAYVVLGKQVTEEQITSLMDNEVKKKPDLKVLIRCDQDAKHLYVGNLMSICRHVGVPEANIAMRTTTQ